MYLDALNFNCFPSVRKFGLFTNHRECEWRNNTFYERQYDNLFDI